MAVQVLMDIARPRVTRTVLTTRVDGNSWNYYSTIAGNTFVCPITLQLFLRPQVLQSVPIGGYVLPGSVANGWYENFTGVYARTRLSQYQKQDGTTPSATEWIENPFLDNGDYYMESQNVNYAMYLPGQPINAPMFLSLFIPEGAKMGKAVVDFGWGEPGVTGSVALRIVAGGQAQVYKWFQSGGNATLVGSYTISGESQAVRRDNPGQGAPSGRLTGHLIDLYLMPSRRRSLVVFSSSGAGFEHVFADLPIETINTITPSGRFWWQVMQGKASVQCVPMKFPTSGYAVRQVDTLRVTPPSGATWTYYGATDGPGYGTYTISPSLVDPGGSHAYDPSGLTYPPGLAPDPKQVCIRVDMTGDGTNTPFVYGFAAVLPAATTNTSAAEQTDIADHVLSIRLNVGEDMGGTKATLYLKKNDALTIAGPDTQSNRPVLIQVDGKPLLYGVTGEPELEGVQTDVPGRSQPLTIPVSDLWAQCEAALYEQDIFDMDGLILTDMIAELLRHAGFPNGEMDIESNAFRLDYSPGVANGTFSYQPKAGDRAGQWIQKLHDEFGGTWFAGWRPTATGPRFRFRSESSIGTTAKADLWLHRGGDPTKEECRQFKEKVLPPEASRISVYGYDPQTRTFLFDQYVNSAVENPALAPSARPTGWRGQVDPLILVEPRLTTPAGVTAAKQSLIDRVGVPLRIAEWKSTLLLDSSGVPLWRGDVVAIHGKGLYRILSFSGDLKHEGAGFTFRDFSYVGKRIGDIP